MDIDVTLQDRDLRKLRAGLVQPDGIERAAYIVFGTSRISADPFTRQPRLRLIVKEVLPVEPDELVSSNDQHVSWKTDRFVRLIAKANREDQVVGIAHSHPAGPNHFSPQDDANEADLIQLAQNRNGDAAMMPSIVVCGDGSVVGRVWLNRRQSVPITLLRTVGPAWRSVACSAEAGLELDAAWDRQRLALGAAFNQMLRRLRVGVVGAGGTGSPLIQQLARMGVGYIAIFDPDRVELTNLNRLYGATRKDAKLSRKKVEVAAREIARMGLGTQVATFDSWIGSEQCREALKSLDVVFGCTDDHDGRSLINRLAYYYMIPVLDLGLALRVSERHGEARLDADGRVTVLEPGSPCLICRRIVDPAIAAEEALRRSDPAEYARRKDEAYVRGEGNPAPAVVSFTTSVATMAIEELIQRLQGFRGSDGGIANRVRRFGFVEDVRPGAAKQPCRICATPAIVGAGDVQPFLGRVG